MYLAQLEKLIEERGGRDKVFKFDEQPDFRTIYKHGILFREQHALNPNKKDYSQTIYSFDEKEGYIPLKELYLEISDPTEYKFAAMAFFNYKHYCQLMEYEFFKKFIDKCRDELELKLRCEAVNKIKDEALKGSGASSITAAKYVIERGWIENKKDRHALKRRRTQDQKINDVIEKDLELLKPRVYTNGQVHKGYKEI